uniref:hypothetical protein n=1 Tax=Amycolatopsis sp. CA-096443 TaxID=3239919 RepID=UPI003F496C5C
MPQFADRKARVREPSLQALRQTGTEVTQMARRTAEPHYHGHIFANWTPSPKPGAGSFRRALTGEEEVTEWMAAQLRKAKGKQDMTITDEIQAWTGLARDGQQITTGLQGGPTILAQPINDGSCDCDRAELRPIPGRA